MKMDVGGWGCRRSSKSRALRRNGRETAGPTNKKMIAAPTLCRRGKMKNAGTVAVKERSTRRRNQNKDQNKGSVSHLSPTRTNEQTQITECRSEEKRDPITPRLTIYRRTGGGDIFWVEVLGDGWWLSGRNTEKVKGERQGGALLYEARSPLSWLSSCG